MPPKERANTRKFLSLNKKLEVIDYFNKTKCSIRKLAQHFSIGKTQAGEIIKKQNKYVELWHSEVKTAELRPDSFGFLIDKYVYQWYEEVKGGPVQVSGPMIQNKALEIAREMGNEEFKASNGWLERFRSRHQIRSTSRMSPRRAKTPKKDPKSNTDEWKTHLELILDTYTAENIFSAVETGLFYGAVPEETPRLIAETCSAGELASERFTILFCIRMDGKKEKPLVIAKRRQPGEKRFDKSKYEVDCEFNDLAWLNRDILTKWLENFDKRMEKQKKNVVLFLSDALYNCVPHLKNIKIVHFSSYLSPENQPLNQGIVQNFKIIYRQLLLKRLIELKEENDYKDGTAQVGLSQGIGWVDTAWREFSESVIHRCFEEIGFSYRVPNTISDSEAFLDNVSNLLCAYDSDVNAVDYVSIDADLVTSDFLQGNHDESELIEVLVDGDELGDLLLQDESKKDEEDSNVPNGQDMDVDVTSVDVTASVMSYPEALLSLKTLERFYLSKKDSKAALLVYQLIAHTKNEMK